MNLRRTLLDLVQPWPIPEREGKRSVIMHPADVRPTARIIDLALAAASRARELHFDSPVFSRYPLFNVWPGQHYRFPAGLVAELQPRLIVEIGTFTGLSSLAMRSQLPAGGRIVTFDLVPWDQIQTTALTPADFQDGGMEQRITNLMEWPGIEENRSLLENADFIFIDAAKDGSGERILLEHFRKLNFKNKPILAFDDIRLWKMLQIWDEIPEPKMDVSSFAHWTGTGLVDWPASN